VETQLDNQIQIEITYAGFWKRVWAYCIDFSILKFILSIIYYSFENLKIINSYHLNSLDVVLILYCIISLLYYGILESSPYQGTLGKQALKIVVVDYQLRKISFWRAISRSLILVIPVIIPPAFFTTEISFCILGLLGLGLWLITVLAVMWTKRSQGLHDLLTGCLIVKRDIIQNQVDENTFNLLKNLKSHCGKIGWFWWLSLIYVTLILSRFNTPVDFILLLFIISSSALVVGIIHPKSVIRWNKPSRVLVVKIMLPLAIISLLISLIIGKIL